MHGKLLLFLAGIGLAAAGTAAAAGQGAARWTIYLTSNRQGDSEIYVMNADGSDVRRLTRTPGAKGFLSWSPDGRKLAFWRFPSKPRWAFYVMNADGSGVRKVTWSLPSGK